MAKRAQNVGRLAETLARSSQEFIAEATAAQEQAQRLKDENLQHRLITAEQKSVVSSLEMEVVKCRDEVATYNNIKQEVVAYRQEAAAYASEKDMLDSLVDNFAELRTRYDEDVTIREERSHQQHQHYDCEQRAYLKLSEGLLLVQAHLAYERSSYVTTEDELQSLHGVYHEKKSELDHWWHAETKQEEQWQEEKKHRYARDDREAKEQWYDRAEWEEQQHPYARGEWVDKQHPCARDDKQHARREHTEEMWQETSGQSGPSSSSRSRIVSRPKDVVAQRRHVKQLSKFDGEPTGTVVEVDGCHWRKSINGDWWPRANDRRGKASQERQEEKMMKYQRYD